MSYLDTLETFARRPICKYHMALLQHPKQARC